MCCAVRVSTVCNCMVSSTRRNMRTCSAPSNTRRQETAAVACVNTACWMIYRAIGRYTMLNTSLITLGSRANRKRSGRPRFCQFCPTFPYFRPRNEVASQGSALVTPTHIISETDKPLFLLMEYFRPLQFTVRFADKQSRLEPIDGDRYRNPVNVHLYSSAQPNRTR